ncbi:hypothetical protein KGF54_005382 [Candida jiufengensis]|uniref:uncharacterized protein n=1 Tax=Candida jiufengensis TaxID=497108 RepID=UPI002224FC79|nr:uncharacterized protein KGF54_005382 [Candida jiufengensis]KAI5949904.1 hypothetical protein KGF54_005382 [Candida jiufengensis]
MFYQINTILIWLFIFTSIQSAILPFKDSIEIAFTPEDVKKTTDYVMWKVPSVRDNFKTTVKQKILNRLLSKELQEMPLNTPFDNSQPTTNQPNNGEVQTNTETGKEGDVRVNNGKSDEVLAKTEKKGGVQINNKQAITPLQALSQTDMMLELELQKPRGILGSILKGPSTETKPKAKIRYIKEEPKNDEDEEGTKSKDTFDRERMIGMAKLHVDEHVGYSNPSQIKKRKHNFHKGFKPSTTSVVDEFESDETDIVPLVTKDAFYDD